MLEFELAILDAIQSFAGNKLVDTFWVVMTHLGDAGAFWVILSIILFAIPKTRKLGIMCSIAVIASALITNVTLKNLVGRARPFNYRDIELLIKTPKDFSFPSGHTAASFAVAFVLLREKFMIKNFKFYVAALILAGFMSFSRLYLYVHFPSDVIASIGLAYLYSLFATKMGHRLLDKDVS